MAPLPDSERDVAVELERVKARLQVLEEQLAARKAVHDEAAEAQREARRFRRNERRGGSDGSGAP